VVDQAPVVLWALDNEGLFTLSEGRGLEALGLEPGEVVGRSVFDVYTGNTEVLNDARKALAGHRVRSSVRVGDLIFESRQRPLVDSAGRVVGVLGVAVDVTARERAMTDLEATNLALTNAYDSTLEGWVRALDLRDRETEGHTKRVTKLTVELARRVGVPEDELVHVRRGALLHDIGKIGIPDAVLKKPGPLDEEEWSLMRQHPVWAHDMISAVDFLQPALDIPYCHHERWDGEGYPRGLAGESIPLSARVFAVVDVWDALRSDRPYSEAWDEERVPSWMCGTPCAPIDRTARPGMRSAYWLISAIRPGDTSIRPWSRSSWKCWPRHEVTRTYGMRGGPVGRVPRRGAGALAGGRTSSEYGLSRHPSPGCRCPSRFRSDRHER
jgi:putative nucleotidyltransferase with HDIG domain/PAS domain S-box-containing protein